jgi:acyl-CoA thioesterase
MRRYRVSLVYSFYPISWVVDSDPTLRADDFRFIMDSCLSFLPLSLTGIPLTSARAASTMDFSLRFFTPPPVEMHQSWMLHEQNTENGADGRTFSIGRMFSEDGVEFARMSQVSILRGPEGERAKL